MDIIEGMETLDDGDRPDNMDDEGGMQQDLTLLPLRYEKLEVNGHEYDLRKADEVEDAQEALEDYRQQLREGELDEYEGKLTEPWGGGRSRLLYDEVRAKMAADFHDGKHSLTYEQQHQEAQRIIKIRATQFRAQGK